MLPCPCRRPSGDPSAICVAAALVIALALVGCGGSKTVSATKAANFLRQDLAKHSPGTGGAAAIDVSCPSGVKAVAGRRFWCHVVDHANGANTCFGYQIQSGGKMRILPSDSQSCFKSHRGWARG